MDALIHHSFNTTNPPSHPWSHLQVSTHVLRYMEAILEEVEDPDAQRLRKNDAAVAQKEALLRYLHPTLRQPLHVSQECDCVLRMAGAFAMRLSERDADKTRR